MNTRSLHGPATSIRFQPTVLRCNDDHFKTQGYSHFGFDVGGHVPGSADARKPLGPGPTAAGTMAGSARGKASARGLSGGASTQCGWFGSGTPVERSGTHHRSCVLAHTGPQDSRDRLRLQEPESQSGYARPWETRGDDALLGFSLAW